MEFTDFLKELVSIVNLPVTILIAAITLYWLMVILGVFGADALDLDIGLEADLDVDAGFEPDTEGMLGNWLAFMHFGDVPVMVIVSLISFFMWVLTVLSNHYLNSTESVWLALVCLVPNIFISLIATKALLSPFSEMLKSDPSQVETRENMIGLLGTVKTSEVTEKFGQIEIQIDGPAIVINARTNRGERLAKGDCAKIVAYNSANDTFTVCLSKWEKE